MWIGIKAKEWGAHKKSVYCKIYSEQHFSFSSSSAPGSTDQNSYSPIQKVIFLFGWCAAMRFGLSFSQICACLWKVDTLPPRWAHRRRRLWMNPGDARMQPPSIAPELCWKRRDARVDCGRSMQFYSATLCSSNLAPTLRVSAIKLPWKNINHPRCNGMKCDVKSIRGI
jgi:hypothetical protein